MMEETDEPRGGVEIHSHPKHCLVTTRNIPGDSDCEENVGVNQYLRDQISCNPIILTEIFRHLDPPDLKAAALVCRTWRRLVEQPRYWSWAETRLTRCDFGKKFHSRRLRNIGSVRTDLSEGQVRKLFLSLPDWNLRSLAVSYINPSSLSPHLLSAAIVKLEKMELCLCRLTSEQVRAVFTSLAECQHLALRSLSLNFSDLTSVPANVLSRAIVRLKKVNLWLCRLTPAQVSTVFTTILRTTDLRLESLTLNPSELPSVSASLLSAAMVRLEEVNLSYTDLTTEHVSQICREILAAKQLRLRSLQLNSTNLSSLEPDLLARAMVRLERVDLYNSCLTEAQLEAVFQTIVKTASSPLSLASINVGGNELSSVPAELLAEASLRLGEVRLADTQLTPAQVTALFTAFLQREVGLAETSHSCLHVGEKEVSAVAPEVLAQAEARLQHCHLTNSWCLNG